MRFLPILGMATAFLTCALLLTGNDTAEAASKRDRERCSRGFANEAISSCTRIVNDRRESAAARAEAYFRRGDAYMSAYPSDVDRAIADYSEAILLAPDRGTFYQSRADAYIEKGDLDRAIADFDEAIRHGGLEYPDLAYANRGSAYLRKGDFDRAIADLGEGIRLGPHAAAYRNRGEAHLGKGDFDGAIDDFSELIKLYLGPDSGDRKWSADGYARRASAHSAKRDYDRAIADGSEAIRFDPKAAGGYRARGLARYYKGDFRAAAADLRRAIDLVKDADAYQALFRYLARERAGEKAGAELEANARRLRGGQWPYAAVELYLGRRTPSAVVDAAGKAEERCEAHFYVGMWHLLQGDSAGAQKELLVARDTCPKSFVEYAAAVAELARLPGATAPAETAKPVAPSPPAKPATADRAVELEFWQSVKDSGNPAMLQAYLDRFPGGSFAPLARIKLEELSEKTRR